MTLRGVIKRLANERDLDALVKLEQAAFTTDLFTRDQIDYLLTRSRATTFVLEYQDQIIGAACVLWRKSYHGARLYNLAIDPAFQGHGLGLLLMKECEKEAARRECYRMALEVREDNLGGLRFYERLGYQTLRVMPDYYHDGTPGIKMSKNLKVRVKSKLMNDVPYYPQSLDFTCGAACLMMALQYFNRKVEMTRSLEVTIWKEATTIFMASGYAGTDGYGLALSALNRKLACRMVMSTDATPMLKSVRIPKKRDIIKIVHGDMKRRAKRAGLSSAVFDYGLDEIIASMHRGWLPIVMISTYRLTGDRVAHWIVVTGFDENYVYIHDPDVASYKKNRSRAKNQKIEKSEFLKMTRYGKEVYRCVLLVGKPNHKSGKLKQL
jgi:ribosomal protein S18 acetylase RimI-like enzyme